MLKKLLVAIVVCGTTQVFAAECNLHIKREACANKEAESYKKCNGKADCVEKLDASSEKDCAKKALKACENARLDITKLKTITADYEGKPVDGGKQFCAADRPDFNKCK